MRPNKLAIPAAYLVRGGCITGLLLLPAPYLFTWSSSIIIINKYDDMIFHHPAERGRKQEGERERLRKAKGVHTITKLPLTDCVRVLLMSVTYYTDTHIKTMECWCRVDMTVYT